MKRWNRWILIIICLLGITSGSARQTELPDSILHSAAEHGALVLKSEATFVVRGLTDARYNQRVEFLVLNEKGRKKAFYTAIEGDYFKVTAIKAILKDADGAIIRKLTKKDIQPRLLFSQITLFAEHRAYPIELHHHQFPYRVIIETETKYETLFLWPNFILQRTIPVLSARYTIQAPPSISYNVYQKGLSLQPDTQRTNNTVTYTYQVTNVLPAIREPYQPPETRIQKAVYFSPRIVKIEDYLGHFDSWEGFANWYRQLLQKVWPSLDNPPEALQSFIFTGKNPRDILSHIYQYVQQQTRYVAIELGIGGWQPRSPTTVLHNKYGDCKDLSSLVIAMARLNQIPAYIALVKTRDRGRVMRQLPGNQFNHAIVCVPLNQDTIWIEATADYIPAGELPASVEGADALIITDDGYRLTTTPVSPPEANVWATTSRVSIGGRGSLQVDGTITFTGNYAVRYRTRFNRNDQRENQDLLHYLIGEFAPTVVINQYRLQNARDHLTQPLKLQFSAILKRYAKKAGKYLMINPNLIHRETVQQYQQDEDRRFPLWFSQAYTLRDTVNIAIPVGYQVKSLPKNQNIEGPYWWYYTTIQQHNDTITYIREYGIRQRRIPLEAYHDFLDFIRQVAQMDKTPIVLKGF